MGYSTFQSGHNMKFVIFYPYQRAIKVPNFPGATQEALLKDLEIQWQDHFQTRAQTWKSLEITAILAVALLGLGSQAPHAAISIMAALLLILISMFGTQITLRHRNKVELNKINAIVKLEEDLFINKSLASPDRLSALTIFNLKKSNTPLFILRIHFVIQLFALLYIGSQILL